MLSSLAVARNVVLAAEAWHLGGNRPGKKAGPGTWLTRSLPCCRPPQLVFSVNSWFWQVHRRTALPQVRQHMEIFAVRMCRSHPEIFLTIALKVDGVTEERTALVELLYFTEESASVCCVHDPGLLLLHPRPVDAMQELNDYRLPGQVLCSLLIIAGYMLVGNTCKL